MTQPYTIPSHPRAINVRRLCALLWRMYMEVPLNDEHTALLGDIIETVGMQLAGGELYTSEVREMMGSMNTAMREELTLDYPAYVAASDVMIVAEAQRLGIGEHAPDGPDIDCQDDYEFYTGTGRYAERAEDEEE